MPDRSRRRPRDPNQLGKLIVDIASGDVDDTPADDGKNAAAVTFGRSVRSQNSRRSRRAF
jgi:hypothetical protein